MLRLIVRHTPLLTALFVLGVWAGPLVGTSFGQLVDFAFIDIEPNNGRTEPGWLGLVGATPTPPNDGANNVNYGPTTFTSATGDMFTFSISNTTVAGSNSGAIDWRDRGNPPTATLNLMGEDFVKNNSGIIRVSLGNMPVGVYTASSFHLDATNSQTEHIRVFVSDAEGAGVLRTDLDPLTRSAGRAHTDLGAVGNINERRVANTAAQFTFVSDGVNPVEIFFDGGFNTTRDETPLNGLQIWQGNRDDLVTLPLESFATIDFGAAGQRVAAGHQEVSAAGGNVVQGLLADTGDMFSITVDNVNRAGGTTGSLQWLDRGDSTSGASLAMLGEDLVFSSSGLIRVQLDDLPAGTFLIEPFTIDGTTSNNRAPEILVYLSDAMGEEMLQDQIGMARIRSLGVNDLTDEIVEATGPRFLAESDGETPIVFWLESGLPGVNNDLPLAGIRLQLAPLMLIPEPGSIAVWTIIGAIVACLGYFRLRRRTG